MPRVVKVFAIGCGVALVVAALMKFVPLPKVQPPIAEPQSPVPSLTPTVPRYQPVRRVRSREPDQLPEISDGRPISLITGETYRVELDLTAQSVRIDVPKQINYRYAGQFQSGDLVEVVYDTPLRVGDHEIGEVPQGAKLGVCADQRGWLAVTARIEGKLQHGWIAGTRVKLLDNEPLLYSSLEHVYSDFVPAAALLQKSKQFDDGLYAAVELAAQQGVGKFAGKAALLRELTRALGRNPPTKCSATIAGAALVGGVEVDMPEELHGAAKQEAEEFAADPLRSKPLGFYSWNEPLTAVFRQDRLLQTELLGNDGIDRAVDALRNDPAMREMYTAYLDLTDRLTNPSEYADLRSLAVDNKPVSETEKYRLFPPSQSHEGILVKKLFADKPIPAEFDLMSEVVTRIRSGAIDVRPTANSGWYDYQTYSSAALLQPTLPRDPARLSFGAEYRRSLEQLFKGAMVLARETHVKQLETASPTATASAGAFRPRPRLYLQPKFSVEPLPELYRRRADGYRLVSKTLFETFGSEALAELRRQTAEGPVDMPLDEELRRVTALFDGAALVALRQAGVTDPENHGASSVAAANEFLKWATEFSADPDLAKDSRVMVPVFYDRSRKATKAWVFLGWEMRQLVFSLETAPRAKYFDAKGMPAERGTEPEIDWRNVSHTAYFPVTAEVYVSKLLNRDEFREHCDCYRARAAILANLE